MNRKSKINMKPVIINNSFHFSHSNHYRRFPLYNSNNSIFLQTMSCQDLQMSHPTLKLQKLKLSQCYGQRQKQKQVETKQPETKQPETKQHLTRQQAIANIIAYSEKNNNLIEQYNEDFFVSYFDRQTIENLAKMVPGNLQMKKDQFVKTLATFIKHNDDQTLFLIISLINMYKKIKDETKSQNGIKFSDFTSHICDKISSLGAELLIPLKEIPGEKAKPDPLKVRSIDLQPPVIVSEVEKQIPQISKQKQKKDKKVDPSKPLSQFFLSPSTSLIMTLGSLSSAISIYSMQFEKKKQIFPSCFKAFDKKLAILSFAFSQKQQRIAAIINNIGVAFWDFSDNFRTEKLIERNNVGNKIFYLELNDEWATASENSIFYWDLKNQSSRNVIKEEKSKSINDICQITHIRAIGVAYTMKDDSKWVIIYQPQRKHRSTWNSGVSSIKKDQQPVQFQFKRLARINLSPSGCHTLYYNRFTQILIPLGYKDTIPLYNIDSQSLDMSLLHQMKGHQTIVTCITQIDQSDIIFTGDDRGNVIVWTLSDMRCQQLIRVANWINSLKCIGNRLYYGDTRINMINLEGINVKIENKGSKYLMKREQFYGIFKSYRSERNEILIFTRKTCRIISMLNGKTLKIIQLCGQQEQILVVQNYFNGYILGTSKGDIYHYSVEFQLKWKLPLAHQSDTTELKVDKNNKFFMSKGRDSNIYVWAEKTLQDEGPRKTLKNGQDDIKEEISFTELSQKFGIFITCSYSNEVRLWDYESCRLVHVLEISAEKTVYPLAVKICQWKPLLYVACSNEVLLIFKFSRKQAILQVKLIAKIDKKILSRKSQRIDKKKATLGCTRGLSAISDQPQHLDPQEPQNRYALSNTLHDIAKKDYQPNHQTKNQSFPTKQPSQQPKTSSFLIQQILFDTSHHDYKLILAYNKGTLIHITLNTLIQEHFDSYNEEKFKKSANIQRPIKQSLIRQIYKSQVDRTNFDKKKLHHVVTLDEKYVVWHQKLHKDLVTHLDVFESTFISTLCVDGYYKLISMHTGSTVCSLNINYPLPISWDYRPHKNQQFCEKIQQALLLLDQIFINSESLNKIQFQALNVRPFLEFICKPKNKQNKPKILFSSLKTKNSQDKQNKPVQNIELLRNGFAEIRKNKQAPNHTLKNKTLSQFFKIQVLSDEFAPEDIKRAPLHYSSLKSHEVYKRVKQFINIRDSENQLLLEMNKPLEINLKKTQLQERQSIIELFSPNYLPKLLNKDFGDTLSHKSVFGQRHTSKNPVTLTKDDFKKIHQQFKHKPYYSVMREKSIENQTRPGSKSKITLDRLPDQIIDKKMQATAFEFRPKQFCQSSFVSINRSDMENINLNKSSAIKMNKALQMKQICEKTQDFKKMHKIVKI